LRQEDLKFQAIPVYTTRPCLRKKDKLDFPVALKWVSLDFDMDIDGPGTVWLWLEFQLLRDVEIRRLFNYANQDETFT
jgi:hypothetical protein